MHQVCDTCVYQHIISTLDSCIVNSVTCPDFICRATISSSVICDILLKYKSNDLLEDYLREQRWKGSSKEWIEHFTLPYPGCSVPIQKNGGCSNMMCSRCKEHFYWLRPRISGQNQIVTGANICYVVMFIILIVTVACIFFVYSTKK